MKNKFGTSIWVILSLFLYLGCSSDDGNNQGKDPNDGDNLLEYTELEVSIGLPQGSGPDLAKTKVVSLGVAVEPGQDGKAMLPHNPNRIELGYLLDSDDNVLLLGLLSDDHREISIRSTVEAMIYLGLDYYLLDDSIKAIFLERVPSLGGFNELVDQIQALFQADFLMYQKGSYMEVLNSSLEEMVQGMADRSTDRLFIEGEATKSGLTVAKLDSIHAEITQMVPRRTQLFVYKKSIFDRNGNEQNFEGYTETPFINLELKPGKRNQIAELEVGSSLHQVITQNASVENASSTGPVALPVDVLREYLAEYELAVVGPGNPEALERDLSPLEEEALVELSKKSYVLDYFLPTLLEIGGNRSMLPSPGDDREAELYNLVTPMLDQYPEVIDHVLENDFKAATKAFLPELYGNVRMSDDLRGILLGVYELLAQGSDAPQTFIQSHELIEIGYPRTQKIMEAVDRNISTKNHYKNFGDLKTEADQLELFSVSSIDADVNLGPADSELCLGKAMSLSLSLITAYDPEVEEFEYHWNTDGTYKGRVQDINGDPNNFGTSIITKDRTVSYISAALESDLGGGANWETITVTVYTKNLNSGELTKVGEDSVKVNNIKGCTSFYVSYSREVNLSERPNSFCSGGIEYSVGTATYVTGFEAVEGAVAYQGRTLKKDGTYSNWFAMNTEEEENGWIGYRLGVGSVNLFSTCSEGEALEEQQRRYDYLEEVGHQGIEVKPQFE